MHDTEGDVASHGLRSWSMPLDPGHQPIAHRVGHGVGHANLAHVCQPSGVTDERAGQVAEDHKEEYHQYSHPYPMPRQPLIDLLQVHSA